MIFFLTIITITLVKNVLGAIDRGLYFELDGAMIKVYLFMGDDDCSNTFICKNCDERFFTDDLSECYLRSEAINKRFVCIR